MRQRSTSSILLLIVAFLTLFGSQTVALGQIDAYSVATKKTPSVDELSRAAAAPDRNGLTKAGRGLQKHSNRENSAFPNVGNSPSKLNPTGQDVADDILTAPGSVTKPNHIGGVDVRSPDGRGIRFREDGSFDGFREPNKAR